MWTSGAVDMWITVPGAKPPPGPGLSQPRRVIIRRCRAGDRPGAEGGRIRPRGTGRGPPRPRTAGPGPRGCRTGPSQTASGARAQIAAAENARAGPKPEPGTPRLRSSMPALTATRRPGGPVLDNPQAQPPPELSGKLSDKQLPAQNTRSGRSPLRSTTMPQPFRSPVTCADRSWRITVFVLLGDRAGPAVRGRRTQHRRRAGGRCECTGTAPPGYRSPSHRLPVSADHRGGGKGRAPRRGQWPVHRAAHRQYPVPGSAGPRTGSGR